MHVAMSPLFLFLVVSGVVQHFQSSLATTGRRHPRSGELLTFTCTVVGSHLDWRVDSNHRARYFDTNRVDEVCTVNGPSIKFRTILMGNEEESQKLQDRPEDLRQLLLLNCLNIIIHQPPHYLMFLRL